MGVRERGGEGERESQSALNIQPLRLQGSARGGGAAGAPRGGASVV